MESFDNVDDDAVEDALLRHIDIPYFRNNPSYISLWQRHYYRTGDPAVLFLMRHKKISQYYHWVYVELSRVLMRSNHHGACRAVLRLGMACGAYDRKALEDEAERIPEGTREYSEHEVNVLLNPKGFSALGRTWNSYREALFYTRPLFVVDGEEVSFEEYRAKEWRESAQGRGWEYEEREGSVCRPTEAGSEPCDAVGDVLDAGMEVAIDGHIYYVKEVMGRRRYRAVCISDEGTGGHELCDVDFLLHEVGGLAAETVLGMGQEWLPRVAVKRLGTRTFLIHEYRAFGLLGACLEASADMRPRMALHLAAQLAEILDGMMQSGWHFAGLSPDSICVCEDLKLKVVDFEWVRHDLEGDGSEMARNLLIRHGSLCSNGQGAAETAEGLDGADLERFVTRCRIRLYEQACRLV